jgi:phage tail sheath protein FI
MPVVPPNQVHSSTDSDSGTPAMPTRQTPGAYVEGTATRAIMPASTAITAFVGHTLEGPINRVVTVKSFLEYSQNFGGLAASSEVSYAVLQFFRNGGDNALIVRVPELETGLPGLGMVAGSNSSYPVGLGCLELEDGFDLLCVPDASRPRMPNGSISEFKIERMAELWRVATDLCRRKRAMVLIDAPVEATTATDLKAFAAALPRESGAFAAVYAPWIEIDDPLDQGQRRKCAPAGTMAGLYARFDKAHGVWEAPAGVDATLNSVKDLSKRFTDTDQETLNPLGINLLRAFARHGLVAWGGRTLALSNEWKYVPVRRLANLIERSLNQGLQWAAFEPNAAPLWLSVRQSIEEFLHTLFKRGAFPANQPQDAYFVKCDATTMTQADIDQGNCLIEIGFAPIKPAEFTILRIGLKTQPPNA